MEQPNTFNSQYLISIFHALWIKCTYATREIRHFNTDLTLFIHFPVPRLLSFPVEN